MEYDPASQWYEATITITAGWLTAGGRVDYDDFAHPPDQLRAQLKRLGLDVESLEREEKLIITDWYTATLGQKSKERHSQGSLRVSDVSIYVAQTLMRSEPMPDLLSIGDDESTFARFNEEKPWVEAELSRFIPGFKMRKTTALFSVMRGVHSEWVYKRFEGASDCIIDFKLDESADPARNMMRIRNMRGVAFDGTWHKVTIDKNFGVTLET